MPEWTHPQTQRSEIRGFPPPEKSPTEPWTPGPAKQPQGVSWYTPERYFCVKFMLKCVKFPPLIYIYIYLFQTTAAVSSPPVHQLTHVSNRLSCFMLLSQTFVFTSFSRVTVLWSARPSDTELYSLLTTLTTVHAPSPGKDSNHTPACPLATTAHSGATLPWNSGHISTHLHSDLHLLLSMHPLTPPAT